MYNENVASWEPFIEPLEDAEIGDYRPYKLQAKVELLSLCVGREEREGEREGGILICYCDCLYIAIFIK